MTGCNSLIMHHVLEILESGKSQSTRREPLQHGLKGNKKTLEVMARMVRRDVHDIGIEAFVKGTVLRDVPAHNDRAEIDACFTFARDAIRWTRDRFGVERVADTRTTLALRPLPWGDCVDKSIVLATFLGHLGHTPYFVCVTQAAPTPGTDLEFNHVYVGVRHKGSHLALDPTPQDRPSGWEIPGVYLRVKVKFLELSNGVQLERMPS